MNSRCIVTKANVQLDRINSTAVNAAGITVALLLSSFAMLAAPVLSESAKLYSFSIAKHSAAFFGWGPWPIALPAILAAVLSVLGTRYIKSTQLKLAVSSLILVLLLSFSAFYIYSVLVAPQLELQHFMDALNKAAA